MGGLVGQPRLGARAAAVRARRRRQRRRRRARDTPTDAAASARFEALAAEAPGCISVERSALGPAGRVERAAGASRPSWRPRASTARSTGAGGAPPTATSPPGAHEARVASEPEEDVVDDEPRARASPVAAAGRRRGAARRRRRCSPTMPVGVAGRHVRAPRARGDRLRRAPTSTPSSAARGRRRRRRGARSTSATARRSSPGCARRSRRRSARCRRPAPARRRARRPARRARLRAAARRRRRADRPRSTLDAIAAVLREHLPPDDPLAGYADRLADPALRRSVRGYLTGSIDLVVRVGDARSRVVDYKTNWLGGAGRGADRLAPPPGRARRRDAARALRPAGAALHGRAAPLPALAAARLRPRAPPRRRPVPVPARDDRAGHAGGRRHAVRRVRLAAVAARSSRR